MMQFFGDDKSRVFVCCFLSARAFRRQEEKPQSLQRDRAFSAANESAYMTGRISISNHPES
jgi:hypothetical protein